MALVDHHHNDEPLQIRQIAAQQNIPDRYLEQLLATLRRMGIVRSQRGAKGGYLLARAPWQITLLDVMACIEGRDSAAVGALSTTETVEKQIVSEVWQESRQAMQSILSGYTLQDLCDRRDARQQAELMYYI